MARPPTADLIQLLAMPTESLTVEHKGWLNLLHNPHKAILAKAAIALANEGGGIIVIGTREDTT
jgi:predicted HTH transcriptional regulator